MKKKKVIPSFYLLVILLNLVLDNVVESELVNTLGSGDNAKPVTELLLLEELLRPKLRRTPVSIDVWNNTGIFQGTTHKYLRYRPEKGM